MALALNLYPFDGGSSTVTVAMQNSATAVLATIGSIVALWLVTGIVDAGGVWRSDRTRMDFLRFSGEWLVYYVLIAIVGGALSGLTVAVFASIQVDVMPFIGEWVLPCGAAGAVLVSAWLVSAKQRVIENIAPVLTKVFTPLFTLMMLALIVASVMQWNLVDGSRDLLIAFDLVLVVVVALLVYSISARDPALPPGWFDRLQVLMLAAALVVDVIVLVAMIARTGEFGFSANKTASLGLNVILLANLAWATWLQIGFVRRRVPFGRRRVLADRIPAGLPRLGGDPRVRLPADIRLRVTGAALVTKDLSNRCELRRNSDPYTRAPTRRWTPRGSRQGQSLDAAHGEQPAERAGLRHAHHARHGRVVGVRRSSVPWSAVPAAGVEVRASLEVGAVALGDVRTLPERVDPELPRVFSTQARLRALVVGELALVRDVQALGELLPVATRRVAHVSLLGR